MDSNTRRHRISSRLAIMARRLKATTTSRTISLSSTSQTLTIMAADHHLRISTAIRDLLHTSNTITKARPHNTSNTTIRVARRPAISHRTRSDHLRAEAHLPSQDTTTTSSSTAAIKVAECKDRHRVCKVRHRVCKDRLPSTDRVSTTTEMKEEEIGSRR